MKIYVDRDVKRVQASRVRIGQLLAGRIGGGWCGRLVTYVQPLDDDTIRIEWDGGYLNQPESIPLYIIREEA